MLAIFKIWGIKLGERTYTYINSGISCLEILILLFLNALYLEGREHPERYFEFTGHRIVYIFCCTFVVYNLVAN